MVDSKPQQTDQEYAEVCYVPNWAGSSKKRADYRFLAIREPLRQLALGDEAELPFPVETFGTKGAYKLFGVVTNKKDPGDQVIWWLRERCGKSEEVHSVLKSDLAGRCDYGLAKCPPLKLPISLRLSSAPPLPPADIPAINQRAGLYSKEGAEQLLWRQHCARMPRFVRTFIDGAELGDAFVEFREML